jgi:mevalonate kinase
MKVGIGSAPGKVILTGEHSVVYGLPAIAVALSLRCRVESKEISDSIIIDAKDLNTVIKYSLNQLESLNTDIASGSDSIALLVYKLLPDKNRGVHLTIESDIPISAGLGSSAAIAVATIASLMDLFDLDLSKSQISELAFESEKIIHGKPSGIDNSITTYGGLLLFQDSSIDIKELTQSFSLVIANTGIERDTKKLVSGVAKLKNEHPALIDRTLKLMGDLSIQAINSIDKNNIDKLGQLMNINQGYLDSIGVGHEFLSRLIWNSRDSGALGAKLTGAGGGGCMIALARDLHHAKNIGDKLKLQGAAVYVTSMSAEGVRIGE